MKKTTVSAGRPRNIAEREALKSNPAPNMWKYMSLPKGRPTKPKETTTVATTSDDNTNNNSPTPEAGES